MKFWVVSPNVSNDSTLEKDWKHAIRESKRVFMGYDVNHRLGLLFTNDVSYGDVVLVAQGRNSNKRVFLCGEVGSKAKWEHLEGTPRPAQNILLTNTLSKKELQALNLDFTGCAFGESSQPSAIYLLKPEENLKDKHVVDKILLKIQEKKSLMEVDHYINLLKNKHQLILQGPPGTGKTRLAKIIAEQITKSDKTLSPLEYIKWYIAHFKSSVDSINRQNHRLSLLREFEESFPKESLSKLNLQSYCQGNTDKDTFCYVIERSLKELGQFSPGQAGCTVFGIYWDKEKKEYVNSLADKILDEKPMEKIANLISDVVIKQDWSEATNYFRQSYLLKILNSYFPEKFFPISSKEHLKNVAKIFEISKTGKSDIELNLDINETFNNLKEEYQSEISNFELMEHLYKKFNLRNIDLSEENISVVERLGDYKIIQFHPSFTYEEFIRGISAQTNEESQVYYTVEDRILIEMANEALLNRSANYVLIIDEINRANLPSVLGELIYALEYRYYYDKENEREASVESLYDKSIDKNLPDRKLKLPENLYIIGTMNTADRSVGHIDYAIRRRFSFIDVLPNKAVAHPLAQELFKKVSELFVRDYDQINWGNPELEKSEFLVGDFRPEDVWIGHSYFISEKNDESLVKLDLKLKLQYEIKPLLKEYIKDGILTEAAKVKIKELDGSLK